MNFSKTSVCPTDENRCLICFLEVSPLSLKEDEENVKTKFGKPVLLWNDLHVIFLLRTVFEVPQERLVDYLVNSGGHSPSGWKIRLCSRCKTLVENVRNIYQDILKCIHVFRAAREELVDVVRESEQTRKETEEQNISASGDSNTLKVVEETRKFVCEHEYGDLRDPFKEGDLMAHDIITDKMKTHSSSLESQFTAKRGNVRSNNNCAAISMLHWCKDLSGERFQCPLCGQIFTHLSKMKFHTIRVHLDHLFESAKLPQVSDEKFQSCCKGLLKIITPTYVNSTLESTLVNSCSHCGKGFTDRRYLHLHWIQHHYQYLVAKLKELQKDPNLTTFSPSSSPTKARSRDKHGKQQNNNNSMTLFTCSQCEIEFTDIGELKVHITTRHTEQYFPPAQFNTKNIPMEKYRSCCQSLFRGEKYKSVGNESSGCPFCKITLISKRYVYVHMLENHYDRMKMKLRQLLSLQSESSPPPPSLPTHCPPLESVKGKNRDPKTTRSNSGCSSRGRINNSNNKACGPSISGNIISFSTISMPNTLQQHVNNGSEKDHAPHFIDCSYSDCGDYDEQKPELIVISDEDDDGEDYGIDDNNALELELLEIGVTSEEDPLLV